MAIYKQGVEDAIKSSLLDAAGDIIQASAADTPVRLAAVALGQVPISQGVNTALVWSATPLVDGLAFPAVQVASADPNTLDDYEEGTFTPGLTFGGASVGMTFGGQTGTYTKVGNLVRFDARIDLTAKGSSTGSALITGLPFSVGIIAPVSLLLNGVSFADWPQGIASTTTVILRETTNAGVHTDLDNTNFVDTSQIFAAGVYRV